MRSPAMKRATPSSIAQWLVPLGNPVGTAMFIEFQDLAGIAIFGVVLTLILALLGAVPFSMPLMLFLLLVATVVCGNMQ